MLVWHFSSLRLAHTTLYVPLLPDLPSLSIAVLVPSPVQPQSLQDVSHDVAQRGSKPLPCIPWVFSGPSTRSFLDSLFNKISQALIVDEV